MKIGEIPANATIQIRVMKGEKKFECLAVVVATRDDGLFLTPIKHDGQLIDFSSQNIQILVSQLDISFCAACIYQGC